MIRPRVQRGLRKQHATKRLSSRRRLLRLEAFEPRCLLAFIPSGEVPLLIVLIEEEYGYDGQNSMGMHPDHKAGPQPSSVFWDHRQIRAELHALTPELDWPLTAYPPTDEHPRPDALKVVGAAAALRQFRGDANQQ